MGSKIGVGLEEGVGVRWDSRWSRGASRSGSRGGSRSVSRCVSRGGSRGVSRNRSKSRGVGESFKPDFDLIDTVKISAPRSRFCQPCQRRKVCAFIEPKAHDAAELQFGAPKAPVIHSMCADYATNSKRTGMFKKKLFKKLKLAH